MGARPHRVIRGGKDLLHPSYQMGHMGATRMPFPAVSAAIPVSWATLASCEWTQLVAALRRHPCQVAIGDG